MSAETKGAILMRVIENYLAKTKTSRATATRDLQDLVEIGSLQQTGERKHTRYTLNMPTVSGMK